MAPPASKVHRVLARDTWAVIEATRAVGPVVLRLRTPVILPNEGGAHFHLLQLVWPYAPAKTGAMPTADDSAAMQRYEDRICAAWEHDGLGFLAAVLTIDGARQWVVYARDVVECLRRLRAMPPSRDPDRVELTTRRDPSWSFLHDDILASFVGDMDPAAWQSLCRDPDA